MPGVSRRYFLFGTLTIAASTELEYNVPGGSDAVQEVRKCVDYRRRALAT